MRVAPLNNEAATSVVRKRNLGDPGLNGALSLQYPTLGGGAAPCSRLKYTAKNPAHGEVRKTYGRDSLGQNLINRPFDQPPINAGSASKDTENSLETSPAPGRFGLEVGFAGGFEIELKEDAHAMSAAATGANRVDAIAIIHHYAPGPRGVENPRSNARMPLSGLFEPWKVIDDSCCRGDREMPALMFVQGNGVVAGQQSKSFGGQFLVIVAGQRQRVLGDERQETAQAICAKAVGFNAGSGGQAEIEAVMPLRQRVGQVGFTPKQVRMGTDAAIVVKPVRVAFAAEFALVPNRKLHRQGREQGRFPSAPAQAAADVKDTHGIGQFEIGCGFTRCPVGGVMKDASQNPV